MPDKRKSIWDRPRPQPATNIAGVYEQSGIQPGVNRPEVPSGTGIVQGGGLTVTNERPAAQPGQPAPMPQLKPTVDMQNPLDLLNVAGQDITQSAKNTVYNLIAITDWLKQAAPGGVLPGAVQPAGQPAMPGPVAPMPEQGQVTGVTGAQTPAGPANITGGGTPQSVQVTDQVAPVQPRPYTTYEGKQ